MAKNRNPMTDSELVAILNGKSQYAVGYWNGKISHDRQRANGYYEGEPFGTEQDGRSAVVSRDVAECIDGTMPSLINQFQSGRDAVKFEAREEKDAKKAEQATKYVNYIWNQQNNGYENTYTWFKSALLNRVGVVKIFWEDKTEQKTSYYEGMTEAQKQMLENNPDVEITEVLEYPDPTALAMMEDQQEKMAEQPQQPAQPGMPPQQPQQMPEPPMLYDLACIETENVGKVTVLPLPPEEFIINSRAINTDEVSYMAHRTQMTASDLIAMGFDRDIVDSLPGYGQLEFSSEKIQRHWQEDELPFNENETIDEASREIEIVEHYTYIDYDGDGIAEYRKIVTSGEHSTEILSNEEIDDHPFATVCPIPLPFKFFGQSMSDQVEDIQEIKSTVLRQGLDNVYNTNNQRHIVGPGVNMADMLNATPGGVIRTQNPQSDVVALPVTNILGNTIQMLEYVDTMRQNRTGVTLYNQGMDSDTLNNTATGAQIHDKNGMQRIELIARNFAETGYKTAMKKILALVIKHQKDVRSFKLDEEFIEIDPKEWKDGFDTSIRVGLGASADTGTATALTTLAALSEKIIGVQEGTDGPLITKKNLYNQMKSLGEAGGLVNMDLYISNPDNMPPQQPKPEPEDPNVAMAKATIEAEKIRAMQNAQEAAAKIEQQERESQRNFALKVEELRLKHQLDVLKVGGADTGYEPVQQTPAPPPIVDLGSLPFPGENFGTNPLGE